MKMKRLLVVLMFELALLSAGFTVYLCAMDDGGNSLSAKDLEKMDAELKAAGLEDADMMGAEIGLPQDITMSAGPFSAIMDEMMDLQAESQAQNVTMTASPAGNGKPADAKKVKSKKAKGKSVKKKAE
jgi:hypothetical protein